MGPLLRILAVLALVTSARAVERRVERTFAAAPGVTLAVDTYRGAITVEESDRAEVNVRVALSIDVEDTKRAEEVLQGLQLDLRSEGSRVTVLARHPAETRARFVWNDDKKIEPAYHITVPRRCNVDLRAVEGSITIGNLSGELRARVEIGNIFFRRVEGTVDAEVEFGDIILSRCSGSVKARTLRGVIRVGTVTGTCDLRNSTGDVEVMNPKADLRIQAEAGNAILALPADFVGKADVRTSGGAIGLTIDPAANCDIEARASVFAKVHSKVQFSSVTTTAPRHLVARLNRGGSRVVLRASGGDVILEPVKAGSEGIRE